MSLELEKTLGDTFYVWKKIPKVSSLVILQRKYLTGMTFEKMVPVENSPGDTFHVGKSPKQSL